MPTDGDVVFVYGTLRSDAAHPMHDVLAAASEPLGTATVRGALFDLGAYPGLAVGADFQGTVRGEAYRLRAERAADTLARLDRYEGREYRRRKLPVLLAGGETVTGWTYVLAGNPSGLPQIESGDYFHR